MFNIEILKNITECDLSDILDTWESAVRATHFFLTENDIISIKEEVKPAVSFVENFACIRNENKKIIAFMGVHDCKIEMLFIHNDFRRKGLGTKLINYAISEFNTKFVDVNEDNPQALKFYEKMGFETFKRSPLDDSGNPFPILHMKLK